MDCRVNPRIKSGDRNDDWLVKSGGSDSSPAGR